MSGALAMLVAAAGGLLDAILTIGTSGGQNGYRSGTFGSLSPSTFTDKTGTSRTVARGEWDTNVSGSVLFSLSGTSIANADTTLATIVIGGRTLQRSSAVYTANDGSGRTQWAWSTDTSGYPTSSTVLLSVR